MSQSLIIWLPETPGGDWAWFISPSNHGIAETDAQKHALADMEVKSVHIILPGQWVRILDHDLPPMKDSERETAIRFFVEENMAANVDSHHIVLGTAPDKRVAIISLGKMNEVMAAMRAARLNPDGIYVDYDCLRHAVRPIALNDRLIHPQQGYTLDPDWADRADYNAATIEELTPELNIDGAINLRTHKFARRTDINIDVRQLSRAAVLLIGLGLSFLLWQGLQARALQQNADYLRQHAATLYTEATGNAAPSNPALAVSRAVNNHDVPSADFLTLSNILFNSVSRIDGITVETLQYDKDNNQFTLRLNYPAFESATDLERMVKTQGGILRSGGVREYSGQLIGDAVLTTGGAS